MEPGNGWKCCRLAKLNPYECLIQHRYYGAGHRWNPQRRLKLKAFKSYPSPEIKHQWRVERLVPRLTYSHSASLKHGLQRSERLRAGPISIRELGSEFIGKSAFSMLKDWGNDKCSCAKFHWTNQTLSQLQPLMLIRYCGVKLRYRSWNDPVYD